jgi:hypothetical protein
VTTTLPEAYDTITNHVIDVWPTAAAGIMASGVPALFFEGVEQADPPKDYFVRFSMQPVLEKQATFMNGEDKRYTMSGVVYLQVYCPRSDERAVERRNLIATVGKKLFRGEALDGCIWFRNVRIQWLDPVASFIRANVVADFEFDEIG